MAKSGITNEFIFLPLTYAIANVQMKHHFEIFAQTYEYLFYHGAIDFMPELHF